MKSYALAMKVAHKMPLLQVILDKLSGISSELCMWPHTQMVWRIWKMYSISETAKDL